MNKFALIALLVLPLASCSYVEVSRSDEVFTITSVKPPKWLRVTVEDTHGNLYDVSVSKRCSSWKEIKVGSKVTLLRIKYQSETDGPVESSVHVRHSSDVCPKG